VDIQQPAAQVVHDDTVVVFGRGNPARFGDYRYAISRGFPVQLVVENEHVATLSLELSHPRPARRQRQGQVAGKPTLALFGWRDDVHRLGLAQQAVNRWRAQSRVIHDKLADRLERGAAARLLRLDGAGRIPCLIGQAGMLDDLRPPASVVADLGGVILQVGRRE